MHHKVFAFKAGGRTYRISQVEMIRALFALNNTLSNALLHPNGLAFLIDHYEFTNNELRIRFNGKVGLNALTDSFVKHIGWILCNEHVLQSFESVFSSSYPLSQSKEGTQMRFIPPAMDGYTITYRGIEKGNAVLIQEIQEIHGLRIPVERIVYTHPRIKSREYVKGDKKRVFTIKGTDNEFEIVDEPPREDIHKPLLTQNQTVIGVMDDVEIIKVPQDIREVNQGNVYVYKKGKGGARIPSSVDESIPGGSVQPIEIQTQEVVTDEDPRLDFEHFLKMKDCLERDHPDLMIQMAVNELPKIKSFAVLPPDGRTRRYAVLRIQRNEKSTFIIEIARPDGLSLSTLLLYPRNDQNLDYEPEIQDILRKLVLNGTWRLEKFNEIFKFKRMSHTHHTVEDWARDIYAKLR